MLMPPTTNSDSDDDLDYVPPADDDGSDSSDDQVEPTPEIAPPPLDVAEQKKQRDALWASFQASLSTPPSNAIGTPTSTPSQTQTQTQAQTQPPVVKRVKIEKTFLFAGKHVTEVVEVPENSEDATKWPRWSPCPRPTSDGVAAGTGKEKDDGKGRERERESDSPAPPPSAVDPSPAPLPPMTTTATSTPGAKRPGPRKPWTALPSIPKASQAKKITTLDKTAMDWRAHVASQSGDVKDELDANRRGGGYLEKVDFLKRVQDRREEAFEGSKLNKRRKT